MSDLLKLRHVHAQLLEVASRLSQIIAAPAPPPISKLSKLRRELIAILEPLLQVEDDMLYPRLMASDDPAVAATARRFSDSMGGLAAAFRVYNRRWDAMFIVANWSGFCHETREVIDQLTSRIARESRELYPLLESLDQAA